MTPALPPPASGRSVLLTLGLLLSLLSGCTGTRRTLPQTPTAAAPFPPRLERVVTPFEVRRADGTPYAFPFLGGLDVPRPQWVDIDGDGDLDLFVQEVTNAVLFFENVGTATAPELVWRSDRFQDLDVGEWYRFVDLDADGDPDLLAEQPFSYIRYYRNDGDRPGPPRFVLAADTLRDVTGAPIFSDRQNIPNVTDIDCDGQPDLFIGRVDGTVMRYEEGGTDAAGIPRFRLVTDRFENIEIIGQIVGSLHGANTMAFGDVDGDGDEDLFWGDFFEPGLLLIENTGTCGTPSLRGEPVGFPPGNPLRTSGYNAPTLGDPDGDGDLDLLVGVLGGAFNANATAADNLYFLEQTPDGFPVRTRRFLDGIDVGSESVPALADLDADGDLDLLVANKIVPGEPNTSRIYLFENQGTPRQPAFHLTDSLALAPAFHYAPALGDLDADGDLDLLVGTWNEGIAFYRNEGTPQQPDFRLEAPGYVELTRGSNSMPALADLDADGDLDLLVGEASGTLNLYRNEGTPQQPAFRLVSDAYLDLDVGRRSAPTLADLDGDGDLDLFVGAESGGGVFLRNDGTPQAPHFVPNASFAPPLPFFATPVFADLDADGDLDLLVGTASGGLMYFRNER
ncbi:hypothetical protein AWN76_015105 [Rhodothermaceae bacterium RA]|nr:hypothetical protein AWN76_015105 [Rhodothermaceae bacterium RA]